MFCFPIGFMVIYTPWSYNPINGYWCGGLVPGSLYDEIDGIQYSNESAINPAATLSTTKCLCAGVCSYLKGYVGTGSADGNGVPKVGNIDGIVFATQSAFNTGVAQVTPRTTNSGNTSYLKGYWSGGIGSGGATVYLNEIDGITYSSETTINPAVNLTVARRNMAGSSSAVNGYTFAGYTGAASAEIDGIKFSDESSVNPSAALKGGRYAISTIQTSLKAWICGGGTTTTEIEAFTFSNETVTDPAAVLAVAFNASQEGGNSSLTTGYIGAGAGTSSNEIVGFTFGTETATNPAATLNTARYGACGVQG